MVGILSATILLRSEKGAQRNVSTNQTSERKRRMDQQTEGCGGTSPLRKNDNGLSDSHIHMHVTIYNIHVPRQDPADDASYYELIMLYNDSFS